MGEPHLYTIKIAVDKARCSLCHTCVRLCPAKVFRIKENVIAYDEGRCILCYGCLRLCPQNAISIRFLGYKLIEYVKYD